MMQRGITVHGPQCHPGDYSSIFSHVRYFESFYQNAFCEGTIVYLLMSLGEARLRGTKLQTGQGAKWTSLEQHQ